MVKGSFAKSEKELSENCQENVQIGTGVRLSSISVAQAPDEPDGVTDASIVILGQRLLSSSHVSTFMLQYLPMSLFTAAVYPGRAVGFLVLGASLHDILTRLKAEPQSFPKLDLVYSSTKPVSEPVIVNLPQNGIRLRFDGQEQRLRLIEILDFSKNKLTYKNNDIARPLGTAASGSLNALDNSSGPNFRHVYNKLLGPSFAGEYIAPRPGDDSGYGLYILSYPGAAFSFPMLSSAWSPEKAKDYAALLSSSAAKPAVSMAIFGGESWADARITLYTRTLEDPRGLLPFNKGKETYPDEISVVKIHGEGRLEMERPWSSTSFWLALGITTPQELVAELGPPDAIYRKSDQRMLIHKTRTGSETHSIHPGGLDRPQDDSTDTDQSSAHTATDASDDDSENDGRGGQTSSECFYNYFYHGFDILVSSPTTPSRRPPSSSSSVSIPKPLSCSAPLVTTKIILHSNVPGSYSFNRHRRCRWVISYLSPPHFETSKTAFSTANINSETEFNSETNFDIIASRLHSEWQSIYASPEEAKQRQRGMVLNRGWGDSPGSSCELLGGWEDSAGGRRVGTGIEVDEELGLGNTTLYGFPGLVFEVLKSGSVSGLTVF